MIDDLELSPIFSNSILEEDLNVIWEYINNHDCAIITSPKKDIFSTLMGLNYNVAKINWFKIDRFNNPDDDLLFVINRTDEDSFLHYIYEMGKLYGLDSIIFKPKNSNAYIENLKSYNQSYLLNVLVGGRNSNFMEQMEDNAFLLLNKNHFNVITRGIFFERAKNEFLKIIGEIE